MKHTNKLNPNISKSFQKAIGKLERWRRGKNPVVTVFDGTYKNQEGKDYQKFTRDKANLLWGKPGSFMMK